MKTLYWLNTNPTEEWGKQDAFIDSTFQGLINAAKQFETVFLAELQTLAAYYVEEKGAYATDALIERAEMVFPEGIREKLTQQTIDEIRESGKCLAFDIATASGFQ